MTTLYRPVLIESAEQAEALPLWTTARIEEHPRDGLPMVAMRIVRGWRNRDLADGRIPHADMVGWFALVPIEAEEETTERPRLCHPVPDVLHRYTTPWTLHTPKETQ